MKTTTQHQPPAGEGWHQACPLAEIPVLGSRVMRLGSLDVALFRTRDDRIFAVHDKCPHKGGPLSQGMVHGDVVTCPLHSWKIQLANGQAVAPDVGCTPPYPVALVADRVWVQLP